MRRALAMLAPHAAINSGISALNVLFHSFRAKLNTRASLVTAHGPGVCVFTYSPLHPLLELEHGAAGIARKDRCQPVALAEGPDMRRDLVLPHRDPWDVVMLRTHQRPGGALRASAPRPVLTQALHRCAET